MSDYDPLYVATCVSDFKRLGFQDGEKWTSSLRVLCTLITVSIISSWCNKQVIGRYTLFFAHWLSGLCHQLAELVMAEMVFLCWNKSSVLAFIRTMKFIELTGSNMLAITNVAICVNLALIVSSHHTMSRVKCIASPRVILGFLAVSLLAAAAAVPFWDTVWVSGTLYWSYSKDEGAQAWVMSSIFIAELIAGAIMGTVVVLLIAFRWPELCQVWQLHRRIKFYIGLTVIALIVDLGIGLGGILYLFVERFQPAVISSTWSARHVHIALDTLVLYSALGVTNPAATVSVHAQSDRAGKFKRVSAGSSNASSNAA